MAQLGRSPICYNCLAMDEERQIGPDNTSHPILPRVDLALNRDRFTFDVECPATSPVPCTVRLYPITSAPSGSPTPAALVPGPPLAIQSVATNGMQLPIPIGSTQFVLNLSSRRTVQVTFPAPLATGTYVLLHVFVTAEPDKAAFFVYRANTT